MIKNSRLGYESVQDEMIPSGDWSVSVSEQSHDGIWKPVWGKREQVKDLYNELTLSFVAPTDQQGLKAFEMVFRVYNDGVAFRYMVPDSEKKLLE